MLSWFVLKVAKDGNTQTIAIKTSSIKKLRQRNFEKIIKWNLCAWKKLKATENVEIISWDIICEWAVMSTAACELSVQPYTIQYQIVI